MPLIVHSPHSGQPVKVRDADIGRAIRDESGRIFYVVERSDGSGHYGSRTRKGSPADEDHYDRLVEQQIRQHGGQPGGETEVLDATGHPGVGPGLPG